MEIAQGIFEFVTCIWPFGKFLTIDLDRVVITSFIVNKETQVTAQVVLYTQI